MEKTDAVSPSKVGLENMVSCEAKPLTLICRSIRQTWHVLVVCP